MMGPIIINTEQQHCAVWWLVLADDTSGADNEGL